MFLAVFCDFGHCLACRQQNKTTKTPMREILSIFAPPEATIPETTKEQDQLIASWNHGTSLNMNSMTAWYGTDIKKSHHCHRAIKNVWTFAANIPGNVHPISPEPETQQTQPLQTSTRPSFFLHFLRFLVKTPWKKRDPNLGSVGWRRDGLNYWNLSGEGERMSCFKKNMAILIVTITSTIASHFFLDIYHKGLVL